MKKGVFVLGFLIAVCLIGIVSAEIRINEVELNVYGSDTGNEWLELYSDAEINMTDWSITNIDGDFILFNITFLGYYVFNITHTIMTDTSNNLSLRNNSGSLIFSTGTITDSSNDDRTWQYCSSNWTFKNNTREVSNNCTTPTPTCTQNWSCSAWNTCSSNSQTRTCTDTNSCGNTTGKPTENQTCTIATGEYIELNWTEEIFNKDEFEIEVDLFNLLSQNYDVKVWITFSSNDTTISEIYNSDDDDWNSGTYYLTSFISGAGNKTKDVKIRLKESYQSFDGNAKIFARLRYNNGIIDEYERTFPISASDETSTSTSSTATTDTDTPITITSVSADNEEIIVLGSSSTKTKAQKTTNSIIYKSKMEYIKDYAPYLLSVVCIFIIIILMIEKTNKTKNKKNV
ncbi:MAG: hypothetical protein AABX17_02325 [Nanoarchaeota archaeon]